jgi:Zn-dependent protease
LLALVLALVVGLTVHEYAHARTAFALGDLTAYTQGRLTLNPLSHLDPFGSLMMLVAGFGWAKPVPIDVHRLGRRGTLVVAAAGPLSNLALAVVAGLPIRFGLLSLDSQAGQILGYFLVYFAYFNILLAVFNLLPIPPLDGWKVLMGVVPDNVAWRLAGFERYGFLLLVGILLLSSLGRVSILGTVMTPFINALAWLILGQPLT